MRTHELMSEVHVTPAGYMYPAGNGRYACVTQREREIGGLLRLVKIIFSPIEIDILLKNKKNSNRGYLSNPNFWNFQKTSSYHNFSKKSIL